MLLVVVADDGQIGGHVEAQARGGMEDARGDPVVVTDDPRGPPVYGNTVQQSQRSLVPGGDLPSRPHDPVLLCGQPHRPQRVPEATQPLRGGDVVQATHQGDTAVARVEEEARGAAATGPLGGDDGREGTVLGEAVGEHGERAVQPFRDAGAAQRQRRVDDPVDPPVEQFGDGRVLGGRVLPGIDGEHQVLPVPRRVHGAAQQPPGERRGGDLVRDQPDHGGTTSAQATGDGVRPVAELCGGLADLLLRLGGEVALGTPVEDEGHGRVRHPGEPGDIPRGRPLGPATPCLLDPAHASSPPTLPDQASLPAEDVEEPSTADRTGQPSSAPCGAAFCWGRVLNTYRPSPRHAQCGEVDQTAQAWHGLADGRLAVAEWTDCFNNQRPTRRSEKSGSLREGC